MSDGKDIIDEYLANCEAKYSPDTYKDRKYTLRKFERHLDNISVKEVSISDVREFLNDLKSEGLARSTLSVYLSTLKTFYQFVEEKYGKDMPDFDKIDPKNYRREDWEGEGRDPLKKEEVNRLISAPDSLRDTLLIALLYYTGCRVSEITDLKVENIDAKEGIVEVIGKGNKRRKTKYPSDLDRLVKRWLEVERKSYANAENNEYFFPSKSGGGLAPSTVHKIIHQAAEKAGIQEVVAEKKNGSKVYKVKPHVLRHSRATHAVEGGVPLRHLKRVLGHSQMETTMRYGKESEEKVLDSFNESLK